MLLMIIWLKLAEVSENPTENAIIQNHKMKNDKTITLSWCASPWQIWLGNLTFMKRKCHVFSSGMHNFHSVFIYIFFLCYCCWISDSIRLVPSSFMNKRIWVVHLMFLFICCNEIWMICMWDGNKHERNCLP